MINGELIVDNFAGGGGASTGIEMATGYSVDIAINHDPEAIRMHKVNHPNTKHYCENVWAVDPVKACEGHPVALAWFSPDCKHFSKAKGGKPKDKNIRGLAWVACRWAALVRPRVIMLENVEEFKTWGPLNRGHHPIRAKQGDTFRQFVKQLNELGYEVQFRELVAADYGAPTKRKRFFMIARCDGVPIMWPKPTHAPADSEEVKAGLLKPYVGAYTQLDFSLPCPSIFDTSEQIKEKYGIRAVRPLAPKTMQRIARGLKKFVLDNPEPFIIQCNHGGDRKPQDIRDPMPTITGKHGYGVVEPYMVQIGQTGFSADRSKDVREPLTTIVSKNEHCLISPTLIQYHSETNSDEVRGQGIENPIMTVDSSNRYGLVTSFLSKFYKTGIGQDEREPLHTVTTSAGHFGETMKPKAIFADAVAASHTSILVGELAKILKQNGINIGQNRLYEWLRENGYLIKGNKRTDRNAPTQRSMDMGLFEVKISTVINSDGSVRETRTTKVTGKGQQYFINKFLAG